MKKVWVVLGNVAICSMIGVVAWRGWEEGSEELSIIGVAVICIGLLAIYNTIIGRDG